MDSFREGHDRQIDAMYVDAVAVFKVISRLFLIGVSVMQNYQVVRLIVEPDTLVGQKPRFLQIFQHGFDFEPLSKEAWLSLPYTGTDSKETTFQQQFTIQSLFEIGKRQIIVLS